jgi:hypothetical protein
MPLELKVVWEGVVPGLSEHRLSIGVFAQPLANFLAALRRIASNIVGDALEDSPAMRGRLANTARGLDIEISKIEGSSSGFAGMLAVQTPEGKTFPLFNDLGERAATELLTALELEGRGEPKSAIVRTYLRSLPLGISRHVYSLHNNGTVLKRVVLEGVNLMETPAELPHLTEIHGNVTGVGFEPGRSEVRVKTEEGFQLTMGATALQVERALELRTTKVKVLALVDETHSRLLRLESASMPWRTSSREEAVFKRWDGLLRRLAQ